MGQKLGYKTRLLNRIRGCFRANLIEKFLCVLANGRSPDSLVGKLLPSNYLYEKGSWREVVRNGISYKLDISDMVDWFLYFGLKDESHQSLLSLCKAESYVIDVGANNGAVMMQMAAICNNGMVFGFEPDPVNLERIKVNTERNTIRNFEVLNLGLGDIPGTAKIATIDETNRGMNRIEPGANSGHQIRVTSIDHFSEERKLDRLDIIKIDTEGYELKILRGAAETLKRFRPVLFIELDDDNLRYQGDSAEQLITFLSDQFGYHIRDAVTRRVITKTTSFSRCHYDVIAEIR